MAGGPRETLALYHKSDIYKLIQRVILKQTEDQYPVAVLWEQLCNVTNAKQGNMTNNEWYDRFNTKVEVAESVGVSFDFEDLGVLCTGSTQGHLHFVKARRASGCQGQCQREIPIVCSYQDEQL